MIIFAVKGRLEDPVVCESSPSRDRRNEITRDQIAIIHDEAIQQSIALYRIPAPGRTAHIFLEG